MRILNKLKQPIFFAKYMGKEEITETVGNDSIRTGDYRIVYSGVGTAMMFISVPKTRESGEAELGGDGVHTSYYKTIVSEKDYGLNVEDIIFTGVSEFDGGSIWEGGIVADGGTILPWSNGEIVNGGLFGTMEGVTLYRIMAVRKSRNHVSYSVRQI